MVSIFVVQSYGFLPGAYAIVLLLWGAQEKPAIMPYDDHMHFVTSCRGEKYQMVLS